MIKQFLLCAGLVTTGLLAQAEADLAQEMERQKKVRIYFFKNPAGDKPFMEKLYEVVLKEMPKHLKKSSSYMARYKQMAAAAKDPKMIARYKYYFEQTGKLVDAGQALLKAFETEEYTKIQELEYQILEIEKDLASKGGKVVSRDWFLIAETGRKQNEEKEDESAK